MHSWFLITPASLGGLMAMSYAYRTHKHSSENKLIIMDGISNSNEAYVVLKISRLEKNLFTREEDENGNVKYYRFMTNWSKKYVRKEIDLKRFQKAKDKSGIDLVKVIEDKVNTTDIDVMLKRNDITKEEHQKLLVQRKENALFTTTQKYFF